MAISPKPPLCKYIPPTPMLYTLYGIIDCTNITNNVWSLLSPDIRINATHDKMERKGN